MLNILIVDDIQENLDVLELLLDECLDINIHSALSGNEALKVLMKTDVDIIITDLMMPNMDGLELTRILKQNHKYKDIPILIVTASSDKRNELILYKEGVFEYLTKPIVQDKLINKVKALTYTIMNNKHKDELIDEQNRSKETTKEFINIFTHELRTPLNLIYNFSIYMKKRLIKDNVDKEKFIKYLTSIEMSADNMLHIINNLLTIGRMEKGHQLYAYDSIDLVKLVEESIFSFELTIKNKNVNLSFSHSDDNITLNTDLNSVKGIINNVLGNAVKYGNDIINISLEQYDEKVILSIEDNGEGIKDKSKVFNMFGMEDETQCASKSTGIGLYFVKLVCEELHIKYSVEDSILGGAKFIFEFNRDRLSDNQG